MALLGPLLKQVSPQPAYKPLNPLVLNISFPVPTKDDCLTPGLSSAKVCIFDLIESAGNKMTLYETPAKAPDDINCHAARSDFDL